MKGWLLPLGLFGVLASAAALVSRAGHLQRNIERPTLNKELAVSDPKKPITLPGHTSTLVGGLTPSPIKFAGRWWRVNAGSTWNEGLDYSVRISPGQDKIRFEIRDSDLDRSANDKLSVRRAELSTSLYGDPTRLPNGKLLWGAYSFNHAPWPDPAGMRKLWGGVYGQIHMGSKFGGSPAFAVRRKSDGRLWITTRGEYDPEGTDRYLQPVSFGEKHDLVYAVTLDPVHGNAKVWLDGKQIVDASDISIGSSYSDSYWAFGLYFSGGITNPVVAEFDRVIPPGRKPLTERVAAPPT